MTTTKQAKLTAERLRKRLRYDAETGLFTRRVGSGHAHAGDMAGSVHRTGYVRISIDGGNITLRGYMCTASGRLTRLSTSTANAPITALPICASVGAASRCGGSHAKQRSKETPILPRLWLNESNGSAGDDSEAAPTARLLRQTAPVDSASPPNSISKLRPPERAAPLAASSSE